MPEIVTKRVKRLDDGVEVIVNAEDFRADLHEEIEEEVDHNILRRIQNATSEDELAAVEAELARAKKPLGASEDEGEPSQEQLDLQEYLAAKRRILEYERGPKWRPSSTRQVVDPGSEAPYVPYMAPPSPGVALRSLGVDPEAHMKAARALQTKTPPPSSETPTEEGIPESARQVTESNVSDASEVIAAVKTVEELDEIEKAENAGASRVGILTAIEKRRKELGA